MSEPAQERRTLDGRFWLKLAGVALGALAVIGFLAGSWFQGILKASLPQIDGRATLAGLGAPVTVERDGNGVPTVKAKSWVDAARALGYLHAQDRFFQMDLSRRRAAGELAALVGKAALTLDEQARVHEFRRLAQEAVKRADPGVRAALEAYADGVNAGLIAMHAKPFEYVLLRGRPEAWKPEDTLLVAYSMALVLQDDRAIYLRTLNDVRSTFGEKAMDFFSPLVGPGDAALDGTTAPLPPIPGPDVVNLRPVETASRQRPMRFRSGEIDDADAYAFAAGSNSLAVAGKDGGAAVLANDMHLNLVVPNTWYRARLEWPGHSVTGITLPGAPVVVAGSNGHIAWGFTNAGTGAEDVLYANSDREDFYRGPDGSEAEIQQRTEIFHVHGHEDVTTTVPWTRWGPVIGSAGPHRLLILHWTEDDPAAANLALTRLNDATTVDEAIAIAHESGITTTNFLVADSAGHIGWTIAGRLPKRVGYTGRWPVYFQYGDRRWDGFLPPEQVPVVKDRDYLWTANQRILGGDALTLLGDNGYFRGARAAQLRDDLAALTAKGAPAKPTDLLQIELDDRAVFLGWWRDLALSLENSDPHAAADRALYDAIRNWGGHAAVDSVGYRLVREFRLKVAQRVFDPIFSRCAETDDRFNWAKLNYEPALRAILTARPIHLLDPSYADWNHLLLAGLSGFPSGDALQRYTWGARNTLHIVHPISRVLPGFLTGWLNMPPDQAPGDADMPRVQSPNFGASERFAVSPGHEAEGVFEMPTGESGHPLSPFYRAGHEDWVHGRPTPFLPGETRHTLILAPP